MEELYPPSLDLKMVGEGYKARELAAFKAANSLKPTAKK